jgi:hypothetical protein
MMSLGERELFVASVTYHSGTVAMLAPYSNDGGKKSPKPNEAWSVAAEVLAGVPPYPGGRSFELRSNLYSVSGVDQDWLRHAFGTVALLVEGGPWPPPRSAAGRAAEILAGRVIWQRVALRYLDGPSLCGRVQGPDGTPVTARVALAEQTLQAGETWTTRPRDGRFDRFLAAPGRATLEITAQGFRRWRQTLDVGRNRTDLGNITLEPLPP